MACQPDVSLIRLLILGGAPLRFKRLFGSEPNKELLIDFLNQLMGEERQIVDLVYNKTEHLGSLAENRKAIFDLLCTGSNGEQFIIECSVYIRNFLRIVVYTTHLH